MISLDKIRYDFIYRRAVTQFHKQAPECFFTQMPSFASVLKSKLVAALIVAAFKIQNLADNSSWCIVCRCNSLSLLFHFGAHIITPTTFVGVGSAKVTLKMHWAAEAASPCSNHSPLFRRKHNHNNIYKVKWTEVGIVTQKCNFVIRYSVTQKSNFVIRYSVTPLLRYKK